MRRDFRSLLMLEKQAALEHGKVELLDDLAVLVSPAIRLLYLSFEEGNFDFRTESGRHVLKGLLHVLPDSKIVEDCHGELRLANKKLKNRRMTFDAMQDCVTRSTVLSSRDITHRAKVDKNTFMASFKRTKVKPRKKFLGPVTDRVSINGFEVLVHD